MLSSVAEVPPGPEQDVSVPASTSSGLWVIGEAVIGPAPLPSSEGLIQHKAVEQAKTRKQSDKLEVQADLEYVWIHDHTYGYMIRGRGQSFGFSGSGVTRLTE